MWRSSRKIRDKDEEVCDEDGGGERCRPLICGECDGESNVQQQGGAELRESVMERRMSGNTEVRDEDGGWVVVSDDYSEVRQKRRDG
jgi:hypothetical protein